jgi:hypothetical protein
MSSLNEYGPFKSIGLIKQMYIVYDVARKGLGKLRMFWLKFCKERNYYVRRVASARPEKRKK